MSPSLVGTVARVTACVEHVPHGGFLAVVALVLLLLDFLYVAGMKHSCTEFEQLGSEPQQMRAATKTAGFILTTQW